MDNKKHIRHSGRHFGFSYPVSLWQRLHAAFTPLILVAVFLLMLRALSIFPILPSNTVAPSDAFLALLATFIRLLISYAIALVIAIPLALLVEHSAIAERVFLPIFDIAQSVPILAFFPLIILLFIHTGFVNLAAIFVLVVTMVWSILFSVVGGLKVIPGDIKAAAKVFGVKGVAYLKKITLPAIVPYLVTGSLLAWASGWNIIIVAEVLHTYIPGGTSAQDLFGIGSMLVRASATGQNGTFVIAILIMVGVIALLNFFVWQKLLHYAERFRFE